VEVRNDATTFAAPPLKASAIGPYWASSSGSLRRTLRTGPVRAGRWLA
jgi:hypothetical protein